MAAATGQRQVSPVPGTLGDLMGGTIGLVSKVDQNTTVEFSFPTRSRQKKENHDAASSRSGLLTMKKSTHLGTRHLGAAGLEVEICQQRRRALLRSRHARRPYCWGVAGLSGGRAGSQIRSIVYARRHPDRGLHRTRITPTRCSILAAGFDQVLIKASVLQQMANALPVLDAPS
jgi:hypothetical protein